ncbi:MAG: DUF86 domain-containing protein [Armatimonadota bacterium]
MWRDDAYLLDIVVAARKIVKFTDGVAREHFDADEVLQNAVMRLLEIIGEAARSISQNTKDVHTEIPWREIVGMRNRLIHHYFRVDVEKVWDTITNDIPTLIMLIEPLVPKD